MVYSDPRALEGFEARKREHIRHALDPRHQASGLSGLGRVRLIHEALPELDLDQVMISEPCLGRPLPTPFFVAGMTAGHADAVVINRVLAAACERRGWGLGVGSQRRDLEFSSSVDRWREFRAEFPDLTLFANLGLSQVVDLPVTEVDRLLEALQPQALAVHANALQEAIQPEGTPHFSGALERLEELCLTLSIPVILKETGCGFSARTLKRVARTGVRAVDVSGLGGTHWGRIEGARSTEESLSAGLAETFAEWGIPTVDAVLAARAELDPSTEIWASGGVRSGLDAAKLIALGAHRVGFAQPALQAALDGPAALDHWMARMEAELRVALFCTGAPTPADLRGNEELWAISTP